MSFRLNSDHAVRPSCASPALCPLSRIRAGDSVRIKQLLESSGVASRLRELGFCEEQVVRLIARQSTFICQVCNARLAISAKLAEFILVEPASATVVN
ncbi:MAG: ferrous iron transport protein A [Pedosphaera sp.]|nr:ferrous iron transport protein A [Pedosphaera sp.]